MSFYIGVIYPDNRGDKWIVLDRCGSVLLVCRMNLHRGSDDVFLAEVLNEDVARIRKAGPTTFIGSKTERELIA